MSLRQELAIEISYVNFWAKYVARSRAVIGLITFGEPALVMYYLNIWVSLSIML